MNRIKHLSVALMLIAMLCIMASCGCEHETVADPAIAATCTTTGLTEGSHCSLCGEVLIAQETIPAIGHTEAINESKDATCTETGLTEGKYCSFCNETLLVQETIPAKGHTEVVKEAKDATCTETGLTEGKDCSVCGAVLTAQETVPAKGHTEAIKAGKKATCTVAGLSDEKYCTKCNVVISSQKTIEATGHDWKAATCTTPKTCKNCGTQSGSVDAHKFVNGICSTCSESDPNYVRTYDLGETWRVEGQWEVTFTSATKHYACHDWRPIDNGSQVIIIKYNYKNLGCDNIYITYGSWLVYDNNDNNVHVKIYPCMDGHNHGPERLYVNGSSCFIDDALSVTTKSSNIKILLSIRDDNGNRHSAYFNIPIK